MINCPNKNDPRWQMMVDYLGENQAYYYFNLHQGFMSESGLLELSNLAAVEDENKFYGQKNKYIFNDIAEHPIKKFLAQFDFDLVDFRSKLNLSQEESFDLLERVFYADVNNLDGKFKDNFVEFLQYFLKYEPRYVELSKKYTKEEIADSFKKAMKLNAPTNIFKRLLDFVLNQLRSRLSELDYYAHETIKRIYEGDKTVLDYYGNSRPGTSVETTLSSFEKNIEKDASAYSIIKSFADKFSLTGSIVLGEQGTAYTSDTNPFHDLDYSADGYTKAQMEKVIFDEYPSATLFRTIPNDDCTTYSYVIPPDNYSLSNVDIREKVKHGKTYSDIYAYDVIDSKGNVVGTYRMEKVLTGNLTHLGNPEKKKVETETGVKAKIVDFFQSDTAKPYFEKNINGQKVRLSSWKEIMKAKLDYSRPKDIHDLVKFNRGDLKAYQDLEDEQMYYSTLKEYSQNELPKELEAEISQAIWNSLTNEEQTKIINCL